MEDRKLTDQLVAALGVQPENSTPSDKTIPNARDEIDNRRTMSTRVKAKES